ncbi:MAG: sigma-54-dependent Fis family transcriptional regulator [Anaeromyxobacter sp.]|nr:sigma-54-dependent Fis family transcriptional regulator [Anaeromyxobacter sp.]MBL0277168.1 sigma-54-dependent Fis family transcriptional regulator [Anaeromyxobacter sp.]
MSGERIKILVVDDEEIVRESLGGWLEKDGYLVEVAADGPSALARLQAEPRAVLVADLKMPGMDGLQLLEQAKRIQPDLAVVIMTAYATVDTAVSAMKLGAYDYLMKPFDPEELSLMMQKITAQQALIRENAVLRQALKKDQGFRDLVSRSPGMQAVFEMARSAARTSSTVLILGESGTGKEVLARAIHAESPRAAKAFVAVSCASLTESLLESELFGHERGAFTGANARHKGKFEAAHGGTLFLDEIGDIGPKLQLDLLRVLEERKFHRIGGNDLIEVDVRIVAATNRDLKKAVASGAFREDLFYRLDVVVLSLPPLRQRKEDIPLLAERFLERLSVEMMKPIEGLSAEAMEGLLSYAWPGNVRELRNALERAAVVARTPVLQLSDLGLPARAEPGPAAPAGGALPSLDAVERRHIAAVLSSTGGNVSQAARVLDIDRVTLYSRMRKYGLKRDGEEDDTDPGHHQHS